MNEKLLQLTHDAGIKGTVGRSGGVGCGAADTSKYASLTFPLWRGAFPALCKALIEWYPPRDPKGIGFHPSGSLSHASVLSGENRGRKHTADQPPSLFPQKSSLSGLRSIWFFFLASGNLSMPRSQSNSLLSQWKRCGLKFMCKGFKRKWLIRTISFTNIN